MSNDKIESLIRTFATELRGVLLQEVMEKISNGAPLPPKPEKGKKRTVEALEETRERILVALKEAPNSRSEDLQRMLGASADQLARPLRQLMDENKVKSEGTARGRKYRLR